ncbi:MAG: hypothetical protein KVP17_004203 [Porospora cf. gigantea B]|uniref:uncharacterized protein n=1 Tax=Porospora cf. gigantea B TaxID=2853592 RepID=UPI00357199C0|nr:MAG: hypothetical protein KVP17_004203 [Porospora cf. gigantea B]
MRLPPLISTTLGATVALVHTQWNAEIVDRLTTSVRSIVEAADHESLIVPVDGAWELPLVTKWLADSGKVDAVVALGCLIEGETYHMQYIAQETMSGLMKVQLDTQIPVVMGLLTTKSWEQADKRSQGDQNLGIQWGHTANRMLEYKHILS